MTRGTLMMKKNKNNIVETPYQEWVRKEKEKACKYLDLEPTPENFKKIKIHTYYWSYGNEEG